MKVAEREPEPISLTLKNGSNSSVLLKQGIRVYTIKDDLISLGLILLTTPSGNEVRSYNIERTICDLFRSRRNIEVQEFQSAVKEYVRNKEKNIPLLLRYAKKMSVEKSVRQYLEVLL